ncbi:hypothetical protein [Flavobacterium sp. GNP002]
MESTDTNAHNGIGANHIFDFKIVCILDFQVIHLCYYFREIIRLYSKKKASRYLGSFYYII